MRVGVYGAGRAGSDAQLGWAKRVGMILGERDHQLITGGNQGVSEQAARGYALRWESDHLAVAYTAARDEAEWEKMGGAPRLYEEINYTPRQLQGLDGRSADVSLAFRYHWRNLLAAERAEAAVIIGGSLGTLSSLTNLFALNRPVGLLLGSGGIADCWEGWAHQLTRAEEGRVFGNVDPDQLIQRLEEMSAAR